MASAACKAILPNSYRAIHESSDWKSHGRGRFIAIDLGEQGPGIKSYSGEEEFDREIARAY